MTTRPPTTEPTPEQADREVDVLIVGGGPAGLAAALVLGRSRRTVLVVDAGEPRNAPAPAMHSFLTRDGTPPGELLALARAEVAGYGVQLHDGRAISASWVGERSHHEERFRVALEDGGTVVARRLVVTAGLVDQLPNIDGLARRWGRDVIHCPYCHGWEVRDRTIGVLATSPMALHQVGLFRQLSDRVLLLQHTGPEPDADQSAMLAARDIEVVEGEVVAVESADDRLTGVRLAGGRHVALEALAIAPRFEARSALLVELGVPLVDHPSGSGLHVPADPMGRTEVAGVWVAGNVTDPMAQVIAAAAQGNRVGAAVNADLVTEDTSRAQGVA